MKHRIFAVTVGLLIAAFAHPAFAAPSVVVDDLDGTDGPALAATATEASVTVVFTPVPGNTNGANFDIEFNKAALSTTLTGSCPVGWVCTQVAAGIRFVSPPDFSGNLAGWSREVVFDLTAATPGTTYPLTVTNQTYADISFQNLPASGTENGSIQILPPTPDANFSPNAGALNLGSAPQSTTASTTVSIDNVGPTGSLLDASCSITNNASVFSVVNGVVNDLTAADTPHEVTVNCSSPAVQVHNGQMTCTHNGDGTTDASPVVYSLACTMTTGPTPGYTSAPAPGSLLAFGNPVKDTADPTLNVNITNGGDADTTLSSAGCSITNNPNSAYSITAGSGAFALSTTDPARVVTVACDTAVVGNHNGGVLSCPHNGSNTASPATYAMNCQVDPVPTFNGTPTAISPVSIPQNNIPLPAGNVTLQNTGDPGSNLSGSCSLINAVGTAIQFAPGDAGAYSLAQNASKVVGVQCNSAAQPGVHSADVSCTHNDPNVGTPSPQNYSFSCTVGQPDPAVYGSTPASGSTIDITDGVPAPEGSADPTAPLEIRNDAQAGDASMEVSCTLTDVTGTAITASPAISNELLAPGAGLDVTFTCDTAAASDIPYEATYRCDWYTQYVPTLGSMVLEAPQSTIQEDYTVTCQVREGSSNVEPDPVDGTPFTGSVPPGGSKSFFIDFNEDFGEGVPGELFSCELASGANFVIVSPVSFPVAIPGDGTVTVEVQGTDPGGVDSISDTLTCVYSDTDSARVQASYPLSLNIGGDARFTVLKDFTDDNPGEVTVDLDCDTGLILDQEKTITEDGIGVTFVVTDFDSGELNCNVTERPLAGYSTEYNSAGSDSASIDSGDLVDGCFYTLIDGGDENSCVITNLPDAVELVITKEWVYPGSVDASAVSDYFELEIHCINVEIEKGYDCGNFITENTSAQVDYYSCRRLKGNGDEVFTVDVLPFMYPGGSCYVVETYADQAVEVDNGCAGRGKGLFVLDISAGSGDSCTITNTVFFEGIPTLSQYGMALMALLMLGMGFVAVRRVI